MSRFSSILNVFSQPPFWASEGLIFSNFTGEKEKIAHDYLGYMEGAYKANGPIFSLILARMLLFSEARFLWRQFEEGRPGELFDDGNLGLLQRPWPNGTTGELLGQMEQDASLAGNSYWVKVPADGLGPERLRRLRPNWVTIITGSPTDDPFDYRAQPVSYVYEPKTGRSTKQTVFLPRQVIHYSPIPDGLQQWLGTSWLTPVIDEIKGDKAATKHKLKFFENGAVPGLVVTYDKSITPEKFEKFKTLFKEEHAGADNAYESLHIGGGSDIKAVGANLRQIEFKVTQGAGESRLASAARVPPVVAGFSEGLQGSTLNTGNFSAARRLFADGWARPQWRMAASSIETIFTPPDDAHLWYDARDVAFLREDSEAEAKTRQVDATTLEAYIRAGFTADSAVEALKANDVSKLDHSGLTSVQLQPPGAEQ